MCETTGSSEIACQVCGVDLTTAKSYCRAKKACTTCLAASWVFMPGGGEQHRFCQQCAKFEPLTCFDGAKRTCQRAALRRSNARFQPTPAQPHTLRAPAASARGRGAGGRSLSVQRSPCKPQRPTRSRGQAAAAAAGAGAAAAAEGPQGNLGATSPAAASSFNSCTVAGVQPGVDAALHLQPQLQWTPDSLCAAQQAVPAEHLAYGGSTAAAAAAMAAGMQVMPLLQQQLQLQQQQLPAPPQQEDPGCELLTLLDQDCCWLDPCQGDQLTAAAAAAGGGGPAAAPQHPAALAPAAAAAATGQFSIGPAGASCGGPGLMAAAGGAGDGLEDFEAFLHNMMQEELVSNNQQDQQQQQRTATPQLAQQHWADPQQQPHQQQQQQQQQQPQVLLPAGSSCSTLVQAGTLYQAAVQVCRPGQGAASPWSEGGGLVSPAADVLGPFRSTGMLSVAPGAASPAAATAAAGAAAVGVGAPLLAVAGSMPPAGATAGGGCGMPVYSHHPVCGPGGSNEQAHMQGQLPAMVRAASAPCPPVADVPAALALTQGLRARRQQLLQQARQLLEQERAVQAVVQPGLADPGVSPGGPACRTAGGAGGLFRPASQHSLLATPGGTSAGLAAPMMGQLGLQQQQQRQEAAGLQSLPVRTPPAAAGTPAAGAGVESDVAALRQTVASLQAQLLQTCSQLDTLRVALVSQ